MIARLNENPPLIRSMRPVDLQRITAIENGSYDYPWGQGIFSDCLIAGYYCIVIEQDRDIVGYSIVSVAAAEAHILNLCVDGAMQGQGYGSLLLDDVIKYARRHKVQRMFLEVRPSNAIAIHLYEQAGFNRLGIRPDYYKAQVGREDALVLALQIGDSL
jgi:ribosomal-protein-alanine N-acetyltransferase